MPEYSAALQTVNPGESVVFTTKIPCSKGLIRLREGTGNFLLSGGNGCSQCPCSSKNYFAIFGANIAIPTGGTVGEISVAFSIDGATDLTTQMIVTPAAVEEYFNVSRATNVQIWNRCCETLTIRNTSDQPILVDNGNLVFPSR